MSRSRSCNSRRMGADSAVYASGVWVRRATSKNRFMLPIASSARSNCSCVSIIPDDLYDTAWNHIAGKLIHTQPGCEFLDADRRRGPKHIRVEPSPRSFMRKHVPLRCWEVLKLPIKPDLHQQKDIEIAWKRCICGKASPEKRPLQLACRSGHPQ